MRFCQDVEELAIVNSEGSTLAPMLRAVNEIASAVKAEFPVRNLWIDTFAYEYTTTPPNITKPGPNVAIRYASWLGWWSLGEPAPSKGIGGAGEKSLQIQTWGKETARLYFWDCKSHVSSSPSILARFTQTQ